jgi:4-amino-4-deoxy-L-arabinose transferase-like glycosyltransferase
VGETIQSGDPHPESDSKALVRHVVELEQRVAELESELASARTVGAVLPELRKNWKSLLYFGLVFSLAFIPALLVFLDRWLGYENIAPPLSEYWCKVELLCYTALPTYSATVLACLTGLLVISLAWRSTTPRLSLQIGTWKVSKKPLVVSHLQDRWSRLLFMASGLTFATSTLIGFYTDQVHSLSYFLALLLYSLAWILREIPRETVINFFVRNREVITAFLLFHLSLILLLANLSTLMEFQWIFALLFLLSLVNLVRFYRQIPPILWVFNLAIVLFTLGINSWAFSVVGDEYSFYNGAFSIASEQDWLSILSQLFQGRFVYGTHPYFSSLIQALSMKLFGLDSFGWRFSSLYLGAFAIVFFYLFFRNFVSRPIALLVAAFLSCSSYIMTFGKVGYNNLQALFAMSLVLWASAWAVRSLRSLAFVTLGLCVGFCFYVYPAALYATLLPVLLLLFYLPPRSKEVWRKWGITAFTVLVVILPLIFQDDYWQSKTFGLALNNPGLTNSLSAFLRHVVSNLIDSFFSFLYIPEESHFVVSSYVDPFSSVLVLLGMVQVILRVRKERFLAFILLGFLLILSLAGVSHDRRFPPTTRMFMLLPYFAFFASVGLLWLVDRLRQLGLVRVQGRYLLALFMSLIIIFNLNQAYSLSMKRSSGHQTVEVLFQRLVEDLLHEEPTSINPVTFLFLTDQQWGIDGFSMLQKVYGYPASKVHLQRIIIDKPLIPESANDFISERDTFVIIQPTLDDTWQQVLGIRLGELGKRACNVREYTRSDIRFIFWYSPDWQKLCTGKR